MKYCNKCKKSYKGNSDYCKICGKKLLSKEKYLRLNNRKSKNFLQSIGDKIENFGKVRLGVIIVVILLCVFFIIGNTTKIPSIKVVSYKEKVPVEKIEEYNVREPYSIQECGEVNVSYTKEWGNIQRSCVKQKCRGRSTNCVSANDQGTCMHYEEMPASQQVV